MKILIADSHWALRAGLRDYLSRQYPDASFIEADSLETTLAALSSKQAFDLCLFDNMIGGGDPIDALKRVHGAAPGTSVIVFSSVDSRRHALRAIENGAAGYVLKSATPDDLARAIERVQAGEIWLPTGLDDQNTPDGLHESQASYIYEGSDSPLGILTPRQRQVLELMATGRRNADIATTLDISPRTVQIHVSTILKLLKVNNRTEAALLAHRFEQAAAG